MSSPSQSDQNIIDSRLVVGAIYVVVFLRPASPDSRSLHWGLYHHLSAKNGQKYHITSVGLGWLADHALATNFMKSIFLIGLVRIGYCHPDHKYQLDAIVNGFPLNQVPPGYSALTCRTWTLHIVSQLVWAGFVKCRDVNALEREILEWAHQQFGDASNNVQPRSIIDSRLCTLA